MRAPAFPIRKGTPISSSPRSIRGLLLVSTLTLAALSLTGCSVVADLLDDTGVTAGSDGPTSSYVDVNAHKVGECFNDQDQAGLAPPVPCTEPHLYEAFYSYNLEDGPFPGDDAFSELVDAKCGLEFIEFAGISYQDSASLDYQYIVPTSSTWAQGDREVLCAAIERDDTEAGNPILVTGSLKGAKR